MQFQPTVDQVQESLALQRLLAESTADVEAGRLRDSDEVFADMRQLLAQKAKPGSPLSNDDAPMGGATVWNS